MSADKYPSIFSRQMEAIVYISPNFQNCARCENDLKDKTTIAYIWDETMLGYLSLDIICSSWLTVFLELRSPKTVRYSKQIMSADKYPSIFLRQMEAIVYLSSDS